MIAPGQYRTGSEFGRLLVRTYRAGLGARAGHDLVIEAQEWRGVVSIGNDETSHQAALSVQADSLAVLEGHGGIKPLTDRDRAEIRKTMQVKVLDTERHRTFEFQSREVLGDAAAAVANGELTIRGVTRPITVRGSVEQRADGPWLRAAAQVVQSDWGIKPYTALLGTLKLRDSVDIEVEAKLVHSAAQG